MESERERRSRSPAGGAQRPDDHKQQVPKQLLKQLAADLLEHTKRLGLFDEMRVKLVDQIESSPNFEHIKSEFKREVESFCRSADLSLPRSRLRERLLSLRTLHNSTELTRSHVVQVARRHKQQLRGLFEKRARAYLANGSLAPAAPSPRPAPVSSSKRRPSRRKRARHQARAHRDPWSSAESLAKDKDPVAT